MNDDSNVVWIVPISMFVAAVAGLVFFWFPLFWYAWHWWLP